VRLSFVAGSVAGALGHGGWLTKQVQRRKGLLVEPHVVAEPLAQARR
jgi:hypothetical protein